MDRPLHPWLVWLRGKFGETPDYDAVAVWLRKETRHEVTADSLRLIAQGQRRPGYLLALDIEAACRSRKITARVLFTWPHYVRQPKPEKHVAA